MAANIAPEELVENLREDKGSRKYFQDLKRDANSAKEVLLMERLKEFHGIDSNMEASHNIVTYGSDILIIGDNLNNIHFINFKTKERKNFTPCPRQGVPGTLKP